MSTKEVARTIFNELSDEQIQVFITMFGRSLDSAPEVEPDDFDKELLADSVVDNDESMPLDDFVRSLGFEPNEL